jgi:voltage-gated potassium channel
VRGEVSERLRWRTLGRFERRIEPVMAALGFVWVALFVLDMTKGLSRLLVGVSTTIWVIFAIDFGLRLALAPNRLRYLRHNWLTALSLVLPALRVVRLAALARVLRAARGIRGLRLIRAVTSINRGMGALGRTMRRRGAPYVLVLTLAVILAGAAGMYALESATQVQGGFSNYGDALWWTAMLVTTIGSAYRPRTPEGRILTLLISLYGIGVLGYITAMLASFFVDRDASSGKAGVAGSSDLTSIRRDIAALRNDLKLSSAAQPDRR